ncbi:MAG: FAD-dependent oxidoreductase [Alistipes onderdonkii]
MIPAGTDNLVVSDKAISVSNLINGSTRLQPVVLLTGQAAGTLAAIAAREEVYAPRSSGAQVAGRPAGAGCVYRAVVRRETRRPRLRDVAAHRSDGHPAYDGRAVPVGEPHVVLSRARDLRQ